MKNIKLGYGKLLLYLLVIPFMAACTTAAAPNATTTGQSTISNLNTMAPERVDVRGVITTSLSGQGQVVIDVESISSAYITRFKNASVLVLPTVPIVGPNGRSVNYTELKPGLYVAVMFRTGAGGVNPREARKIWIEEII